MNRPELAPLIPGDPRMDSLLKGTCELSRRDGQLWVDRADPRILVSLELISSIASGAAGTEASVDTCTCTSPGTWHGAVIRIDAANRTVLYRLTEWVECCCGYIAEWPD